MTLNPMGTDEAAAWCDCCAQAIARLDEELSEAEARKLAKDLYAFERTRAMSPEAAAEFVAVEMTRPERPPFASRSMSRLPRTRGARRFASTSPPSPSGPSRARPRRWCSASSPCRAPCRPGRCE